MSRLKSMKRGILTGALALAFLGGCQGEESSTDVSGNEPGAQTQALTCTNLVPVMTSATTPSGTVTSSGQFGSTYPAWKAFDDTYSFWLSPQGQSPVWLAYELPSGPKVVQRYAVTYANGSLTTRAPRNWTLDGWNGSTWVTVDTRTNQTGWTANQAQRREFEVMTPGAYSKYRLNVMDDNDPDAGIVVISIARLELLDCGQPYPVVQALWTRTSGAPGGFSRVHDVAGDSTGRNYVTGVTTVGLEGQPTSGSMDSFLTARDANGVLLWSRQITSPNTDVWAYGIARSQVSGSLFVGGLVKGSLHTNPSAGLLDAFLTKYSSAGVRQWTRQFGAPGATVQGFGVAVDASDNTFLVGSTDRGMDGEARIGRYDAFVAKYNATGTRLWSRTLGYPGQETAAMRVACDNAGNVYVSGDTNGNLDGHALTGDKDIFITKYDTHGEKQWTRLAGAPGVQAEASGATTDPSGNVYVTGHSLGGIDGVPTLDMEPDIFAARFSPEGVKQWVWELDTVARSWGTGIQATDTAVYVSGNAMADVMNPSAPSEGVAHNFVAKLSPTGTQQWVVQQGTATRGTAKASVRSNGLTVDSSGNLYLGGFVDGDFDGNTLKGAPDTCVTKLPAP
ncbi:SBBP repeat-containing protein [Myxococcus stipitatus]|uniref:SBBP repeat-containing protein n=1 Tax=Myxococcus stipitatus TaxID=83455 RepID=UPI0030D3386D